MRKNAADREFARYKVKGEPKALARVLNLLAPELLLVAAHFARDESEAEDLVQTTFLDAIESVDRFDPARPLRPWLIGILVRLVRRARQKAKRALDPHRLPAPRQVDPVALAQQKELSEAFDRALTELPEQHQQVLRLHLVHGFTSGQIALSLGHPPPTVRTWLRRGKEVLRRVLPAGLTGAVLGPVCAGRGLAAMRDVVLGAAKLATPASVATGWGTWQSGKAGSNVSNGSSMKRSNGR